MPRPLLPLLLVLTLAPACADRGASSDTTSEEGETGSSTTSTSTTTSPSTSDEGASSGPESGTDTSFETGSESESDTNDGNVFVGDVPPCGAGGPERCSCGTQCDPWLSNDCPEGEKCTAVACESGGSSWDSNVCRPIQGDQQAGEPCMGDGLSGNDDCDLGLMCWDMNPDNGLGYCVEFCDGDPTYPLCPEGFTCPITGDGVLNICLPQCDPLAPDCPNPDNLCVPSFSSDGFMCTLDASGGLGTYGAPCNFINSCNQGLQCITAESVPAPECTGAAGCCSPVCDVNLPNTCPGAAEGQECVPFYEELVPGYEHVGICAIPPDP